MPVLPPPILTVSELNRLAKVALEQRLPLLWVSGEISNLTRAPSGHCYFSLKDATAQVRCVMFRGRAQLLPWKLENGQQVEAQALPTLYEARGDFQLNVETLRRAGLGKLYEAFVRLRDRLAAAGLFAEDVKRPLPRFPRCIGIVSSPKAAALRDILVALRRRAGHVPVVLYPTAVQGEGAAAQIAAAIGIAGARRECDVLIVARGGGSIEDLWAFNEEPVALALRACPVPVVTGVGHETDLTIADMAADLRAATPTAAAEMASAGWHAAAEEIAGLAAGLRAAMRQTLERRSQALDILAHRLVHPARQIERMGTRLAHLGTRLEAAVGRRLQRSRARLADLELRLARSRPDGAAARARMNRNDQRLQQAMATLVARRRLQLETLGATLAALSPHATLGRGYSIVQDAAGRIVRNGGDLRQGDPLTLRHAKGHSEVVVTQGFPD